MVPDAPNWLFSTLSFIGFILCMIPLPWHLEASNVGTCLFMIWTGVMCLIYSINSIVWNSDVIDRAPLWCDITTKFWIGCSVAVPAASLCINRRLYHIASVQSVTKTRAQKRRDLMIDLAIGLGIPLLIMILHVVVQSHRYAIYEEIGCVPFIWDTPLAYVLVKPWPIVIGLVSGSYCIRTIRELAIRRAQFKEFLSTNKNMSSGRYLRLMGLAGVDVLFTVPLATYMYASSLALAPLSPYVNWDYAHNNFNEILQYPSVVWRQSPIVVSDAELSRYSAVLCAVVFFAFFGFADEARKNYHLAYVSVAKRVGLSTGARTANGTSPDTSYSSHSRTMPVFTEQQTEKKHNSVVSLSDYGGTLVDVKKESFSPMATSSGSMSKESLPNSPMDLDGVALPTFPKTTLDNNAPPRYTPDAPHAV